MVRQIIPRIFAAAQSSTSDVPVPGIWKHAPEAARAADKNSVIRVDYRKLKPGRPPVLLLGGLSQVWPLGFAQIPVILATSDPKNQALASRYICGYCLLPDRTNAKASLIATLLEAGRELHYITGSKPPIFCGNDDDLALTYEFRDALAESCLLFGNDPELGLSLLEKNRFHALARERELPVPHVYSLDNDSDNTLLAAENPVIVKPRSKEMWEHSAIFQTLFQGKGKAKVFPSGRALLAQPGLAAIKDQIVIQDYIPGSDDRIYSFHGLADGGELIEWFLGRKIRTFPKFTGESSFIELTKDHALFQTGCEIARKLGLKGVFKMDFKRDDRDGRFYLLEINARFNLWHYLGAVNGVNIPRSAYEYMVYGIRREPSAYITKYKWQHFLLDYHAYRELREFGEIDLWRWLSSLLRARRVQNVFLWKDPVPFIRWASAYFFARVDRWLSTAL